MLSTTDSSQYPNILRINYCNNLAYTIASGLKSDNIYLYDCANLIPYQFNLIQRQMDLEHFITDKSNRDLNGIHIFVHNISNTFYYSWNKFPNVEICTMSGKSYDDMIIIYLIYFLVIQGNQNITIYTEDNYLNAHDINLKNNMHMLSILDYLYIVQDKYEFNGHRMMNTYMDAFRTFIKNNCKTKISLYKNVDITYNILVARVTRFATGYNSLKYKSTRLNLLLNIKNSIY